jgi:hypothetical protein
VKLELFRRDPFDPFQFNLESTIVDSTAGDGAFDWLIPATQSSGGDYKVRVIEPSNPAIQDFSDLTFVITAPRIGILSPGLGDRWNADTIRTIVWETDDLGPSDVKIELTKRDNNIVTTTIVASTPNTGSFAWPIPPSLVPGDDYRIKISSVLYPSHSTVNPGWLSITPPPGLYVDSPKPGERWKVGSRHLINWTHIGMPDGTDVQIDLYKGTQLQSTLTTAILYADSFPWLIPASQQPGDDYRIKITSLWDPAYVGYGDGPFLIEPETAVEGSRWSLYY